MIKIKRYPGRLGNQLFVYSLARILSKELNYNLVSVTPDTYINNEKYTKNKLLEKGVDGSSINKLGIEYNIIKTELIDLPKIVINENKFNLKKIIEKYKNKKVEISLDGYFQIYSYYKNYKEDIKKWLNIDNNYTTLEKDTVVINVRGGDCYGHIRKFKFSKENPYIDYSTQQPIISPKEYIKILDNIKFNKIIIVTEYLDDPCSLILKEHYKSICTIRSSTNEIEDFKFLTSAKKLIISVGTFSWWAAWLSEATEIYMPYGGYWVSSNNINLKLEEKRYKYFKINNRQNLNDYKWFENNYYYDRNTYKPTQKKPSNTM